MKGVTVGTSHVPNTLINSVEQNLKQYVSIDKRLAEQLNDTIIKSIARCCKDITSYNYLINEYGFDDYLAKIWNACDVSA
jgi:hypothetical protein